MKENVSFILSKAHKTHTPAYRDISHRKKYNKIIKISQVCS